MAAFVVERTPLFSTSAAKQALQSPQRKTLYRRRIVNTVIHFRLKEPLFLGRIQSFCCDAPVQSSTTPLCVTNLMCHISGFQREEPVYNVR